MRKLEVGSHIQYVDPKGVARDALVTTVWANVEHYRGANGEPGCNLIFVSGDDAKNDGYGRQTEHATSVTHKSMQPAHGNYWKWPDE